MGHWEKQWIVIPNTTMKQFKWVQVSQDSDKATKSKAKTGEPPKQRRLFTTDPYGDNSRANLGLDEDSNMSTASDSMEGLAELTAKPDEESEVVVGEAKQMTTVSEGGVRYTGETNMSGQREGRGECVWPNNDRYVGDFANGLKNGNGILYFANGDKRVGVWKDDKLHGRASYYYAGGRIDAEVWEEDHKVSEQRRKLSPF